MAALGKPIDHEDLIDHVLDGLDTSYNSIIESVNSRDTPISFEELQEKLINKEFSLAQAQLPPELPATAFSVTTRPQGRNNGRQAWKSAPSILPTPPSNNSFRQPKPYLGRCQWCGDRGHIVTKCPKFIHKFPTAAHEAPRNNRARPQANTATTVTLDSTPDSLSTL